MDSDPATASTVIDPAATAPAPAVAASGDPAPQKKPGFLASLLGDAREVERLNAALATSEAAHAATRAQLATALDRVAAFEEMEARLEAQATAREQAAATATAEAAAATAAAAAAREAIPVAVAAGVRDTVAALGVAEESLPAAQTAPDKPGTGGEFAHLKGRERAAAAFNAQFATN
jgi:hypothetical protein